VVTLDTVRSVGAAPTRRSWRVVGAALAVIGGVILGVAMADVSAAILRSALLSVGVAAIGLRTYRVAHSRVAHSRSGRRTEQDPEPRTPGITPGHITS
jgi:hypothetical protein